MNQQPRKGQTSLDFLMTYGWAVLLVVVVVASLFALGVFNAGSFLGPRATGFSQLGVIAWNVNAAGILSLKLQNFAGMDISVINIEATYGTSHYSYDITNVSIPNSKISDTFTVGTIGGLSPGQYYTLPLRITYIDLNGFNYTETGTISGTVGAGAVPPSVRINSPHSDSLLNNRTINISVSVWGGNLSQTDIMIIDETGTPVNVTTSSQLGTYSVLLSVDADGVYNITALANYTDGGSASATASNITVNVSAQLGPQCGDPLDISDHVYALTDDVSNSGTCFTVEADNVTLDCNGSSITGPGGSNGYIGVDIAAGHLHATVKNCVITGFGNGINLENGADYGTIENNTAGPNTYYGIYIFHSSNNIISNNTADSNPYGAGIVVFSSSNNSITGNTANSNTHGGGISVSSGADSIISDNTAISNTIGIGLDSGSTNNTIANNTASSNSNDGIDLSTSSNNNTIINNTVDSNNGNGIWLNNGANYNVIANNTVVDSTNGNGIIFTSSSNNILYNNFLNNTYDAYSDSPNLWNTTLDCGTTNIVGGPCVGGNYWADPSGTGFSENCSTNGSSNSSGICTVPYGIAGSSDVDGLPLTMNFTPSLETCGTGSTEGMVSYWKAENDANDELEANNGILENGATFATGQVGQAFSFGGGSYVDAGNDASLNPTDAMTLEAWYKPNGFNQYEDWIIGRDDNVNGRAYAFGIYRNQNLIGLQINGADTLHASLAPEAGQWYHLVASGDSTNGWALYVNGTNIATTGWSAPDSVSAYTNIGRRSYSGNEGYINGLIDEVAIYNRSLTADEIQQHYQRGLGGQGYCAPAQQSNLAVSITSPLNNSVLGNRTIAINFTVNGTGFNYTNVSIYNATDERVNSTIILANESTGGGASGVDDSVWITDFGANTVSRINKSTDSLVESIPAGQYPYGIAVDPYSVWVANDARDNGQYSVSRINKSNTSDVATINLIPYGSRPIGIAVDRDYAWVVLQTSSGLAKINKTTNLIDDGISLGINTPDFISVDSDSVWVGGYSDSNIARINKSTGGVTLIDIGGMSYSVAVDEDYAWFTCLGTNQIARVEKSTGSVVTFSGFSGPLGIAADDSYLWVSNSGTNELMKMNKSTGEQMMNTSVGSGTWAVDIDSSYVWTVSGDSGIVTKVEKATGLAVANISLGSQPRYGIGDGTGYAYDMFFSGGESGSGGSFATTLTVPSDDVYRITATAYDTSGGNASSTVGNITVNTTGSLGCVDPPSGLVAWWTGDGNTTDIIGGDNGTLYGDATYAQGEVGQAFSLGGSGYVTAPNSPVLEFGGNDFTISWWEYRTDGAGGKSSMARDATTTMVPWLLGDSGGYLQVYMSSDGANWDVASARSLGTVNLNSWQYFVVERDGNNFHTYQNGIQQDSWTSSAALASNSNPLSIGYVQSQSWFAGQIDEVQIYDRALSDSEIQQIYDAGSAGTCRPVPPKIELSDCGNISYSGDYVLTGDVGNSGTCFTIEADNVALDCAGHNIAGTGSGNGVGNTGHSYLTVENCNITGFTNGIEFDGANYGMIENNTANSNSQYGIHLLSSSNNTVADNTANSNSGDGIFLLSSSSNTISNNTANSNSNSGITIYSGSNYNNASNNTAISNSNWYGIYLYSNSGNTLTNNTAGSNGQSGIVLGSSSDNVIANNTANSNSQRDIYLSSSSNNTLTGNTISTNGTNAYGIRLESNSNNNALNGNNLNITSTNAQGIHLFSSCINNTLAGNSITTSGSGALGIMLYESSNNALTGNNINTANVNAQGVQIYSSSNNNLTGNTISTNGDAAHGIYLYSGSNNNNITGNTITVTNSANSNDIRIEGNSLNNLIKDNTFTSSSDWSLLDIWSSYNTITDNTFFTIGSAYCGVYVSGSGVTGVIVTNNSITASGVGKGIQFAGVSGNTASGNTITTSGTSAHGIHLTSSQNNNLSGNNVTTNGSNAYSIRLESSSDNTIANNTAASLNSYSLRFDSSSNNNVVSNNISSTNSYGVSLWSSTNNTFTSNNISSLGGEGAECSNSNYNTFTSNNISSTSNFGARIVYNSAYNTFTSNNIFSTSSYGMFLDQNSNYNNITSNDIVSTSNYGVSISSSSGNAFYDNLINGTTPVSSDSSPNYWNTTLDCGTSNIVAGPCTGGNFWAQPDGLGFSETQTDCDANSSGLCANNHTINSSNVDQLPLTRLPKAAVDNHVWVTCANQGAVQYVDKTTNSVSTITLGGPGTWPVFVAADDSFVWVSNYISNTVSKISKATNSVIATIPTNTPTGISVDRDFIWVNNYNSAYTVSKFNKTDNSFITTVSVTDRPYGSTGDSNFVWVTHYSGSDTIQKINKATNSVVAVIDTRSTPIGITGDDNFVWVANSGNESVQRIDKTTDAVMATIYVGASPSGIAVDGSYVWVAVGGGINGVKRIDKATDTVVGSPMTVGAGPSGVSIDSNFVWVANTGSNTVSKIDKATAAVVATIPLGGTNPQPVMHGDGTGYSYDMFFH